MGDLMDVLQGALGGRSVDGIASQLGVDRATAQNAIGVALPVLIGALSRNASTPQGADALNRAVERDHDGSVLDDVIGMVTGGGGAGESILGHVLGGQRSSVQSGIGRASGLDAATVAKLLAILAPIVMGALGRAKGQGNLDSGGLADVLSRAQDDVRQQAPAQTDLLTQMLDANHDGSIADDVARLGTSVLGGLFGRKG